MHGIGQEYTGGCEITWNGKTVWVNNNEGHCIGRFSARAGVDIHNTLEAQRRSGVQCLECTVAVGKEGWDFFVEKMFEHHNVTIPAAALHAGANELAMRCADAFVKQFKDRQARSPVVYVFDVEGREVVIAPEWTKAGNVSVYVQVKEKK